MNDDRVAPTPNPDPPPLFSEDGDDEHRHRFRSVIPPRVQGVPLDDEIAEAFKEVHRVLKKDAHFLFSFHVGDEIVHFDNANGIAIDIDLHFLQTNRILKLLHDSKFKIIDTVERLPYPDVEYATKRAYVWVSKM